MNEELKLLHKIRAQDYLSDDLRAQIDALTQRQAAQTEREAFEWWYADHATKHNARGLTFTVEGITELREDDHYGEHRTYLNNLWIGWQARASLPAPQQATPSRSDCPGCEGRPSITNSPCAVCGGTQPATPPQQAAGEPVGEPALAAVDDADIAQMEAFVRGDGIRRAPFFPADSDTLGGFVLACCAEIRKLRAHPAPGVPEGWHIAVTGADEVVVRSPYGGPGAMTIPSGQDGTLSVRLLSRLCRDMLTAERDQLRAEVERLRADAERLDHIEKHARCDPKMDGQHVWWPTNFKHALRGPTLRAAIDNAIVGASNADKA